MTDDDFLNHLHALMGHEGERPDADVMAEHLTAYLRGVAIRSITDGFLSVVEGLRDDADRRVSLGGSRRNRREERGVARVLRQMAGRIEALAQNERRAAEDDGLIRPAKTWTASETRGAGLVYAFRVHVMRAVFDCEWVVDKSTLLQPILSDRRWDRLTPTEDRTAFYVLRSRVLVPYALWCVRALIGRLREEYAPEIDGLFGAIHYAAEDFRADPTWEHSQALDAAIAAQRFEVMTRTSIDRTTQEYDVMRLLHEADNALGEVSEALAPPPEGQNESDRFRVERDAMVAVVKALVFVGGHDPADAWRTMLAHLADDFDAAFIAVSVSLAGDHTPVPSPT